MVVPESKSLRPLLAELRAARKQLAVVVAGEPVELVETLAARLVAVCLRDARVQAATVVVHKPGAPIALSFADVSVQIRRTRAAAAEPAVSDPAAPEQAADRRP